MKFIRELSIVNNDPAFQTEGSQKSATEKRTTEPKRTFPVHSRKTDLTTDGGIKQEQQLKCPIHKANHSFNHFTSFRAKPFLGNGRSPTRNGFLL